MSAVVQHDPQPVLCLDDVGIAYRRKMGLFRYSQQWAIRHLSFDVQHGETLGIVGHNGAGKSTLLRLLAGIVLPDEGQLITRVPRVSLLALNVGLVKFLTGRENAILGGMLLGATRDEMMERLDSIIAYSGLEEYIDQPVATYSSGMRARLGFSVAFLNDPDVLLIDELMGVGDREFKDKSSESMRERIKSDKTVILVSHANETLRELCDRVAWLDRGQLVKIGPAQQVLAEYEQTPRKRKNL